MSSPIVNDAQKGFLNKLQKQCGKTVMGKKSSIRYRKTIYVQINLVFLSISQWSYIDDGEHFFKCSWCC